jgi:DNA-binding response OmpR family regulator
MSLPRSLVFRAEATPSRWAPDSDPRLLLTGEDRSDDQIRTLKAVGFIKKPFDADELLNAIQAALPHHRGPASSPGVTPID